MILVTRGAGDVVVRTYTHTCCWIIYMLCVFGHFLADIVSYVNIIGENIPSPKPVLPRHTRHSCHTDPFPIHSTPTLGKFSGKTSCFFLEKVKVQTRYTFFFGIVIKYISTLFTR